MSWQVVVLAGVALVVAGGFAWYERSRPPARLVGLVAALSALAVAGRLVLAPIPNVVATTDVAVLTGYALGGPPGFAVGALAAPISNIWLGQGPWTAWQMAGWGMAGLLGAGLALIAGRRLGRLGLATACAAIGLAYGALLDLSVMVSYGGEQSLDRYLAISARGIPFNIAHAAGNFAIAFAAGPALVRVISRYRTRLEFSWRPAGALPAILAVLALVSVFVPRAEAAGSNPTVRYLVATQNADGGFGATLDFPSSPAITGWAMLGLEAAGRDPLAVRERGRTPVDYLRAQIGRVRSAGDLERTVLALAGAGINPRRFGGTDLVVRLRRERGRDGSVDGQVNLTAFFVLAMRAAGADPGSLARPARWLRRAGNGDGGWGIAPGAPSDADSSGAALQALAAAGSGGNSAAAGVRWLRRAQRDDGSWALGSSGLANSQSTAWAIQGLIAAGGGGEAVSSGLRSLARLRAADGHYRYSRSSDQTPVWVSAQVLTAVERRPFPLAAVAPERSAKGSGGSSDRGSAEQAATTDDPSAVATGSALPAPDAASTHDSPTGSSPAAGNDSVGAVGSGADRGSGVGGGASSAASLPAQSGRGRGGGSGDAVAPDLATAPVLEVPAAAPAGDAESDSPSPWLIAAIVGALAAAGGGFALHRRRAANRPR